MGLRDVPRGLDRNLEGFLRDIRSEISKLGGAPSLTRADVQSLISQANGGSSSSGGNQWPPGTEPSQNDLIIADRLADAAITARKIAEETINATHFARGLTPVEVVDTLPTDGNFEGRTAVLTTDGKLYRFINGAWSSVVDAADIAGALTAAQIASGAITSSKLATDLATRIDLIDANASVAGSVANQVAAEALARANAIVAESQARSEAIATSATNEATARTTAIAAETSARNTAISSEADARAAAITSQAGITATNLAAETLARTNADNSLSTRIDTVSTSAANNAAAITSEQTTRANADTALSTRIDTVVAASNTNAAAIQTETNARTTADSALSSRIDTVVATANTNTAAIQTESTARANADSALSLQMSLLSAGVGGGFDPATVFYFETDASALTGTNATLSWSGGMVTVTPTTTNPQIKLTSDLSPGISGAVYPTVKLRIQRVSGSGWTGNLYYKTAAHGFTSSYYKAIPNPSLAVGDYYVIEADMTALTAGGTDWSSNSILNLRLDLGASTADVFKIDWISIGRNAPAASVASLTAEQNARAAADTAETSARQTLSTKLTGTSDPSSLSLSTLASGLLYDEKQARTTQDSALATQITSLQATVDTNTAAISTESTARASADSALSTRIDSVTATSNSNTSAITSEATTRANADTALSTRIDTVTASANTNAAAISSEATTRATADTALSTRVDTVSAQSTKTRTYSQSTAPTTGMIAGDLWFDTGNGNKAYRYSGTAWVVTDDTRIATNAAAISTESTARASADSALSTRIDTVTASANSNAAAITSEATTRATSDTALSNRIDTVSASASTNAAAITSEATTRASADTALSSRVDTVSAQANKTRTYSQSTQPTTGMVAGDLWFDTGNGNKAYRYNGTAWAVTDDTRIATNAAAITSEQTARASADSILSSRIDTVSASTASNAAAITSEATTRATADTALSTRIDTVSAQATKTRTYSQTTVPTTGMVAGDLWFDTDDNNKAYRYSGTAWAATDDVRITTNAAAITSEATARATEDSALSSRVDSVVAQATKTRTYRQTTAPTTGMLVGDLWFDTDDGNKAYRYTGTAWEATDNTRIDANTAAITSERTARMDADGLLASDISTIQTTVGNHTASIQTQAATLNGLQAQYTVKLDNNGYVSGFGLSSDTSTGTPSSEFFIRSDRFAIISPSSNFQTVSALTRVTISAGVVGQLTSTAHGLVAGDAVGIQNESTGKWNRSWTVWQVVNANTVYLTAPGSDPTRATPYFVAVPSDLPTPAVVATGKTLQFAKAIVPFSVFASDYTIPGTTTVVPKGVYLNGGLVVKGSIKADQLAANAVTAGKIDANAVTTGTIQVGAVKADQIDTGAITAGKLGAGSVTTQALAVGMAGNMLQNSNASNGTDFVELGRVNTNVDVLAIWDENTGWAPKGGRVFAIHENGVNGTSNVTAAAILRFLNPATNGDWPVTAGKYYEVSCRTGAHRCRVAFRILWLDQNGASISSTPIDGNTGNNNAWNDAEMAGGPSLTGYKTCYSRGQAPGNAVKARVEVIKFATKAGNSDSWMFVTNAMFLEVPPYASEPAPWSPGGVTLIGPGSIVTTNLITQSSQIGDAVISTANIGYAQITNAKIGLGAVDTLRVGGNAVTTMVPVSSFGGYTNGSIYLPNGAQGLFFLARAGVGEDGGTKPVQANLQIKFNGGEIANGGNSISPGFGGSVVNTAWLGSIGAGNWGFEAISYKGGGAGTLHQYDVFIVCIALLR